MRLIYGAIAVSAAMALAACGDNKTDDVVQTPAGGGVAQSVTEKQGDIASTQTALALGMTRKQFEDADLVSATGVDLGDVETIVLDSAGTVTHLVIEIDGPEDVKVLLPLEKVSVFTQADGDKDLKTSMTKNELLALPRYIPAV